MVVIGSMMWGATGPMMEWMLSESPITVSFMLTIRLLVAGIALLLFIKLRGQRVTMIWRNKYWATSLVLFGLIGMLGVQYTFVATIDISNAVFATLLQFLAPIFIILYVSFTNKKLPPIYQVLGILGTLVGLFLLLTNGKLDELLVSNAALLSGLALGFAFAFYTVYPVKIMDEWGVMPVVAWSMIVGGSAIGIASGFWQWEQWAILLEPQLLAMMLGVIFFGTIAFVLFLGSITYITPVETSVLSSMEPLTATVISILWLGRTLEPFQMLGIVVMLVFVAWLSIEGDRQTRKNNTK